MKPFFAPIHRGAYANYVENYDLITDQHYHNCYELYYLCSGERTYIIDNKLFACHRGDVVFVKPNVLHGTTGSRYSRIVINFKEDFLADTFQPEICRKLLECFHRATKLEASLAVECKPLFGKIISDYESANTELLSLHLGELLLCLNNALPTEGSIPLEFKAHPQLAEIIEYIGDHFNEIETIEEIASRYYFSKYYLCHMFKESTGVTVLSYLINLKIIKASELLLSTKKTISLIAENCGFHSATYFCNTFKKYIGMSPNEYRKKLQSSRPANLK